MSSSHRSFDFSEWHTLAHSDPEAFELKRQEAIEDMISNLPQDRQQRLRCLQWRIDMERQRSRNPMQSCLKLYQMMMDSVYGEHGLLETIRSHRSDNQQKEINTSTILPFKYVANENNN